MRPPASLSTAVRPTGSPPNPLTVKLYPGPLPVKLIALDPEDLAVMAVHLQDAVGKIGDMTYLPRERRFVALLNRFSLTADPSGGQRHRSALRIERVTSAQVSGIDLKAKGQVVSVLTAAFEPDLDAAKAPAGYIVLVLAGGGAIRLAVECVEAAFEDLGPVWAARAKPNHPDAETP